MDEDIEDILFGIRRSVRYHERRGAHYDFLQRLTNIATILLAGVVLMQLAGATSPLWVRVLAGIGAILSALDLVVGFGRHANLHRDLRQQFIELERRCHEGNSGAELMQRRLDIESREPAVYRALDVLCHNEICACMGYSRATKPEYFYDVPWYRRATANYLLWSDAGDKPTKHHAERPALAA